MRSTLYAACAAAVLLCSPCGPNLRDTVYPSYAAPAALEYGHNFVASPQNGTEWPRSFRPYGWDSLWNRKLPSHPKQYWNSDAIIHRAEDDDLGPSIRTHEYGAGWDFSHPIVFASISDPVVTTVCNKYCEGASFPPAIHIPARARAASGSDHHLGVIQPDGNEVDFWLVHAHSRGATYHEPQDDWKKGDRIVAGSIAMCGNFYTGRGIMKGAATAGGACLAAGLVRQSELAAGLIPHALFMGTQCVATEYLPPASQEGDNRCVGRGPHVPFGAHIWARPE
jgi:hypothetical protein